MPVARASTVLLAITIVVMGSLPSAVAYAADIPPGRPTPKNPNDNYVTITKQDSSDDLWARALWLSLPTHEASSEEVNLLFSAAIARATTKAPIYVSLGDTGSGPNAMREVLMRAVETMTGVIEKEIEAGAEAVAAIPDLPKEDAARILHQAIQESYRKAANHDAVQNDIQALIKLSSVGSDASERYYLAAVAEDPDYKPAWLRLALRTEGEIAAGAIDQLIRVDPDNALPHYLRAAAQVDNGAMTAALESVQTGNRKKAIRIYPAARPTAFSLRYPDTKEFRSAGIVGESVSDDALDFLVSSWEDAFSFNDPLPRSLSRIARAFVEEGECLRHAGQIQEAIAYLIAVREMWFHLITAEPHDARLIAEGNLFAPATYDELMAAYRILGDKDGSSRLEASQMVCRRLRNELMKLFDSHKKLSEAELKAIFLGKRNYREETRRSLEQALVRSGALERSVDRD